MPLLHPFILTPLHKHVADTHTGMAATASVGTENFPFNQRTFPLLHNFNYNANMESVLYQNVQQNRTIFSLLTDFPIYKVGTPGD